MAATFAQQRAIDRFYQIEEEIETFIADCFPSEEEKQAQYADLFEQFRKYDNGHDFDRYDH